ncbi:hypothetical protein D3C76_887040 [compost metagenome]
MLGLGAAMSVAGHHGTGQTQAARQFTGKVADDVAVEVGRDKNVEALRATYQVGSGGIDQQIVQRDLREVLRYIANAFQEQPVGHVEAVGLVNGGDFLATLHSQLECTAGDTLAAMTSDFTSG